MIRNVLLPVIMKKGYVLLFCAQLNKLPIQSNKREEEGVTFVIKRQQQRKRGREKEREKKEGKREKSKRGREIKKIKLCFTRSSLQHTVCIREQKLCILEL